MTLDELNARKVRLLRKHDHKLGQAFKQAKYNLVEYFATRISTTLEIFGKTKLNKTHCHNWIRIQQLSRDFDQYNIDHEGLKLRRVALPSSSFREMIHPLVLYCCNCFNPFFEGYEKEDDSVYCSMKCAQEKTEDQGK